jgi:hypothetical protein
MMSRLWSRTILLGVVAGVVVGLGGVATAATVANSSPAGASPHVRALRAQARQLYAPAALYWRSLTPAQSRRLTRASKRTADQIDTCQKPYQKQLFRNLRTGTRQYRVYRIYEDGGLMEQYQARVAVVEPELGIAAHHWSQMQLTNTPMRRFAHALGSELLTSIDTPRFHTCRFLHHLAAHHFSLRWATRSADGRRAARWMKILDTDDDHTSVFWKDIQSKRSMREGLLSKRQLGRLVNLPGELS